MEHACIRLCGHVVCVVRVCGLWFVFVWCVRVCNVFLCRAMLRRVTYLKEWFWPIFYCRIG